MRTTTQTVIIGAGQAGLALSRCLTGRGHEHIVLDRGRVAQRWRSERWNSLRLLTPNWMTRLPDHRYDGPDPDGFMTATEAVEFFTRYAASFAAPVVEGVTVERLASHGDAFTVDTDHGRFTACNVVIATGWCDRTRVPSIASRLPGSIHHVDPSRYRTPDDLPDGGVLVVGASATGVQLAHEMHHSGRPVTIAVGSHTRMPRTYRGMDTFWWLDQLGVFDRTVDEVVDVARARTEPSLQLVGRPDRSDVDLPALHAEGVRLVGRLTDIDGPRVTFAADLAEVIEHADCRMRRTLDRIDRAVEQLALGSEVLDAGPIATLGPTDVPTSLDLDAERITSVVWATGHVRPYEWLDLPILGADGEIVQRRGVTPVAGAYVLGMRFQHRRNSNFIDGVGRDAVHVADHLCARHSTGRTLHATCRQN